jgi:hypothetical protein
MTRWLVVAFALSACGGKSPPRSAPARDAVAEFHDILAPLWHAEEGPQRVTDTCNAVPELQTRAQAVADARKDQASGSLVQAVTELAAECGGGRAAFNEKLAAVHEAFHVVAGH